MRPTHCFTFPPTHTEPAVAIARAARNSFDTVLIPTKLVVDTCYATFVKLEGDKLGEAETKTTWEQRLAMVASNQDADEGEQEAFVVSKYDLVPESLADMVQVGWVCPFQSRARGKQHTRMALFVSFWRQTICRPI